MYADWVFLLVQHDIFCANDVLFCTKHVYGACQLPGRNNSASRRHMYAIWFVILVQHDLFRANNVLLIRQHMVCPEHVYGASELPGGNNGPS